MGRHGTWARGYRTERDDTVSGREVSGHAAGTHQVFEFDLPRIRHILEHATSNSHFDFNYFRFDERPYLQYEFASATERRTMPPAIAVSAVAFAIEPPAGAHIGIVGSHPDAASKQISAASTNPGTQSSTFNAHDEHPQKPQNPQDPQYSPAQSTPLTPTGTTLWIPLVRRTRAPFANYWALPGGPTEWNETLTDTALRTLTDAVLRPPGYLEQLYAFGAVERSAQAQRLVTIAYWAQYGEHDLGADPARSTKPAPLSIEPTQDTYAARPTRTAEQAPTAQAEGSTPNARPTSPMGAAETTGAAGGAGDTRGAGNTRSTENPRNTGDNRSAGHTAHTNAPHTPDVKRRGLWDDPRPESNRHPRNQGPLAGTSGAAGSTTGDGSVGSNGRVFPDENVAWFSADRLPELAFDHADIVAYALWRLRMKTEYSSIAHRFLGSEFTLAQLRRVHEAILGQRVDPANFRRQLLAGGDLVETGGVTTGGAHRPAKLYRFRGDAADTSPG